MGCQCGKDKIITDKNDSLLSFCNDIRLPKSYYEGTTGAYSIPLYEIPFKFTYHILRSRDKEYIEYEHHSQNTMFPGLQYPADQFKQAQIIQNY